MYPVATVAVENASTQFDKPYTYLIPPELLSAALPGCRVAVPFGRGNRRRTGILLETGSLPDREGLKPLADVLDIPPLLGEEGLRLLRYLRETTFCTWFDALRLLIPAGAGVSYRMLYRAGDMPPDFAPTPLQQELHSFLRTRRAPVEEEKLCKLFSLAPRSPELRSLVEAGALLRLEAARQKVSDEKVCMVSLCEDWKPHALTEKQKRALDFLSENQPASLKEVCYYAPASRAVLDALRRKGAVRYCEQTVARNPYADTAGEAPPPPPLTGQQLAAYEALSALLDEKSPKPALLYGVTGSGKTEVFLRLIEKVLLAGRQVLVLVPEIALTSQTVRVFLGRFGARVAVLHSGLSLGERTDAWHRVNAGGADVVVGTRSAVFAPLHNLGLIVMDEEQEHTYHSEMNPRFHARDVAALRSRIHGALLLLASATPSVESYHAAQTGRYHLVRLSERYGPAELPDVYIIDMKDPQNLSDTPSLSNSLREELCYNLERGEQSILLLNRRGYSTVVKCSSCGAAAECPHCSVSMTYHAANGQLICHYCGYMQSRTLRCPRCESELIRYSGAGTQKLEEELGALFPAARVLRVDMDTTLSKFSHERLFGAFSAHEYDIMIGTQMVAKGLNFPAVTLVGVLCADQSLYGGDFRSFERSFALLTQVVGRSGRGGRRGRALIQTYSPENPVIRMAADQDYPAFYRQEIESRRLHLYPPFCTMASIGFTGEAQEEVRQGAEQFLQQFRETAASRYPNLPARMLGPAPAELLRAAGKYRYKLILKCKNSRDTRLLLEELLGWFAARYKTVRAFVDLYGDRF